MHWMCLYCYIDVADDWTCPDMTAMNPWQCHITDMPTALSADTGTVRRRIKWHSEQILYLLVHTIIYGNIIMSWYCVYPHQIESAMKKHQLTYQLFFLSFWFEFLHKTYMSSWVLAIKLTDATNRTWLQYCTQFLDRNKFKIK